MADLPEESCPFCKAIPRDLELHEAGFCQWVVRCLLCGAQGPKALMRRVAVCYWDRQAEHRENRP